MTDVPLLDRKLPDGAPAFFGTVAAYGKARGVSRQAASQWNKRDGHIVFAVCPVTGKRVIDAAASDERRTGNQNPLKRQATAPVAPDPAEDLFEEPAAQEQDKPAKPVPVDDPYKRSAAEAVSRDKWLALRQRELKVRQEMGELARFQDLQDSLFQAMRRVRDAMQSVASECCERANPDDPATARRAIQAEIDKKLTAVAIEVERVLSGADTAELPEIGAAPEAEGALEDA